MFEGKCFGTEARFVLTVRLRYVGQTDRRCLNVRHVIAPTEAFTRTTSAPEIRPRLPTNIPLSAHRLFRFPSRNVVLKVTEMIYRAVITIYRRACNVTPYGSFVRFG